MSLNRRIVLLATLVLAIFISLTALALERAFIKSSETALHDTFTSQLYALMAVAEVENNTLSMPSNELHALLGLPSSGIYAAVINKMGQTLWQSSSVLGANPPQVTALNSGEKQFKKISESDVEFYIFSYGVDWASGDSSIELTFSIATDLYSFNKKISQFRQTLWGWLITMAALLLFSQAVILRWGLSPLRKVGVELNRIETGKQQQIQQHYPQEIERLTSNINVLLQQEREQKSRYRNALGDLAHSLKTPLAVLQTSLNNKQHPLQLEQISRMNSIVEYQLQRAATAGSASSGKIIPIEPLCLRLLDSLHKVYRDKQIKVSINIEAHLVFNGDEGDLMELLGNILDNAFKWARQHIEIEANQTGTQLLFSVSDDGSGIAHDKVAELLKRGKRADLNTAGHGIGLSIVQNIVSAYHGKLTISQSQSGGAKITVML